MKYIKGSFFFVEDCGHFLFYHFVADWGHLLYLCYYYLKDFYDGI